MDPSSRPLFEMKILSIIGVYKMPFYKNKLKKTKGSNVQIFLKQVISILSLHI